MARAAKSSKQEAKKSPKSTAKAKPEAADKTSAAAAKTDASAAKTKSEPAKSETADNGQHVKITPPAPKKSGGGAAFVMVLFIIAVAGAYLSWPKWRHHAEPYLPKGLFETSDPRVAGISDRLAKLETEAEDRKGRDKIIAKLESERQKLSQQLDSALKRIESIEQSIDTVREMVKSTASAEEALAASKALRELKARLAKLEADRQSAAAPAGGDAGLSARGDKRETMIPETGALADRLSRLENAEAAAAEQQSQRQAAGERLAGSMSAMEKRLAAVEKRPAGDPGKAADRSSAAVLAVAQLRDAVRTGSAFATTVDAVKKIVGDDPGMKAPLLVLEKHAKTGIPTVTALRGEFSQLAGAIVRAASEPTGAGWMARAADRISSLVRLRRIDGGGDADTVDAVVARAEAHLADNNLAEAVSALAGLKPLSAPAHEAAAPWLERAKGRLAAKRALSGLHVHAMSLLAPAKE